MALSTTKGYTFGSTELLTSAKLHTLVDSATVNGLTASACALLSTTTVSFAADADTTLYTVPTGYRCVLSHAVIVAAADCGTTDISIGADGAETDFVNAVTLSAIDAQYDAAHVCPVPADPVAKIESYAAATVIQIKVASHAGSAGNTVYLFGMLYAV